MRTIDIVFKKIPDDYMQGPDELIFVEVESPPGTSVSRGEWVEREDGWTVLRLPDPEPQPCILQSWVSGLGLRHQGVLVSAIRGCDGQLRESPEKYLVRFYRGCILLPHCGDIRKAVSYMLWPEDPDELFEGTEDFFAGGLDHYPMHWLTHFLFAAEILGYYYPPNDTSWVRGFWNGVYNRLVKKLHLYPETKEQLDRRLNADEETFRKQQQEAEQEFDEIKIQESETEPYNPTFDT